jgi:hypothetical protein
MNDEDPSDPQSDNFGKYLFILLMAFFLSLKLHSHGMTPTASKQNAFSAQNSVHFVSKE